MQLIRKIIFDFRIICKSVGVGIRIYKLWENDTVGFVKLLSKKNEFSIQNSTKELNRILQKDIKRLCGQ